jgi:hypothetical protein
VNDPTTPVNDRDEPVAFSQEGATTTVSPGSKIPLPDTSAEIETGSPGHVKTETEVEAGSDVQPSTVTVTE